MTLTIVLVQAVSLLASIAFSQAPTACTSQWQLDRLLQTTNTLFILDPADQINQSFNYSFSETFFSAAPKLAVSASSLNCPSFSEIDYRIVPTVSSSQATVTFQATGMRWASLVVTLWLSDRDDMFIGSSFSENFQPSTANGPNIMRISTSAPVVFFNNNQTYHLTFITGIRANSTQAIYAVNSTVIQKFQDSFLVSVVNDPATSLTYLKVDYVIFNTNLSLFSSGGGFYAAADIQRPYYTKVHRSFVPINYMLLGFDKIRISGPKQFSLEIQIDQAYILGIQAINKLAYAEVVYLTIGQKTNIVCSSCPATYIYFETCIAACPISTYAYSGYANGGQSCLSCSAKVNEQLNPQRTGCICLDGFTRSATTNECVSANLIAGGTVIITNTTTITNTANTTNRTNATSSNSSNSSSTIIVINPVVPLGCGPNKTLVNNQCVCDSVSISLAGGVCQACPVRTYKSSEESCFACLPNCEKCANGVTCESCSANYTLSENRQFCRFQVICPLGFFSDSTKCLPCPANCSTCNSSTCTSCINQALLSIDRTQCLAQCPLNQTFSGLTCVCDSSSVPEGNSCFKCVDRVYRNGLQCSPCLPQCQSCETGAFCARCIQGFFLSLNKTECLASCGANSVAVNGSCECDQFSSQQFGGGCAPCGVAFYKNQTRCAPCIPACLECTNGSSCLQCLPSLVYDAATNTCAPPACPLGTTLVNGTCECPGNSVFYQGSCIECLMGTYKSNQLCLGCMLFCSSCSSNDTCSACINNRTFNPTTKACECSAPRVLINDSCSECPNGTVYSQNQGVCVNSSLINNIIPTCGTNQVLSQNLCVCNAATVRQGGQCLPCASGFFKSADSCLNCISNCESCSNATSCNRCRQGYSFVSAVTGCVIIPIIIPPACRTNQIALANGSCVCDQLSVSTPTGECVRCPTGTTKDSNQCKKCSDRCAACSSLAVCTRCDQLFQLNLKQSRCCSFNQKYDAAASSCVCKEGFFNISSTCQTCPFGTVYIPGNMTCGNNAITEPEALGNCTGAYEELVNGTCQCNNRSILGTLNNNSACIFCGPGMYPKDNKCVSCIDNCDICYNDKECSSCKLGYNGTLCKQCATNYINILGSCILTLCGNSAIDSGEECDDGNRNPGDGCSSTCKTENGYYCALPTVPVVVPVNATATTTTAPTNTTPTTTTPTTTTTATVTTTTTTTVTTTTAPTNKSICSRVFNLTSQKITSAGIFMTYNVQNGTVADLKAPVVVQGPTPSSVTTKKNGDQVTYLLAYCGVVPQENVTVVTRKEGNVSASYRVTYDLSSGKVLENPNA